MSRVLLSIFAGVVLVGAILVFSVGVLAPYLPQEIARPAWRGTFTFQSAAAMPLHVLIDRGTVYIETADRETIAVEAKLRVYPEGAATRDHAQAFGTSAIDTEERAGAYLVRTQSPPPGLSVRSDLKVTVPLGTDVRIENKDGTLRVGPACGNVTARLINGDMLVYSPRGQADLETVNGRVLLLDSVAGGRASTVDGSIYARLRGGSLDAEATNGFIGVTLLDPAVHRCRLTSINGAITLGLAPTCRVMVDAETQRGEVTSDLTTGLSLRPGTHVLAWRGEVRGAAATEDDGPVCQVSMRTRNGNLAIREGG